MYPHLLDEVKKLHPQWQRSVVKNTLLVVALLLEQQTVNLWKLKGSVGKLLGNTQTDCRSHYQCLKRCLRAGEQDKGIGVSLLRVAVSLLQKRAVCLILDGSNWKWGGRSYHFLTLQPALPRGERAGLVAGSGAEPPAELWQFSGPAQDLFQPLVKTRKIFVEPKCTVV